MYYTFGIAKQGADEPEEGDVKQLPTGRAILMTVLGIGGLVLGGKLLVDNAIALASAWGMSEAVIGLTVVAIGTSLPELATSAVAAFKKQADIAIGNVVGSNIFNVFWILGISSFITPLPLVAANNFDMLVAIGASLLLFVALFLGRRHLLERWQGIVFVVLYVVYLGVLLF
jgi:cation:H+ antiporter